MSEETKDMPKVSSDMEAPKALNYIEKLVAELCPGGVEYIDLAKLGKRNPGTSITASKMKQIADSEGEIRIFAAGNNSINASCDSVPEKDIVKSPSIIVKSRGNIGFEYYEGNFTHKSELWSYTLNDKRVNQKFIYYFLLTCIRDLQNLARSKSVKLPQLAVRDTDKLMVPVPPLEVQNAIVEILDKFTKLEAELAARRAQYEYYRNSLFENLSGGGSEILGNLVKIKNGKSYKGFNSGDIPVYGSGGIMTYIDRSAYTGPSVLIPRKGSLGNIFYVDTPFWNVDTIFYTEINREQVTPKYLYHALQVQNLSELNTAGGVPSLTQTVLKRVRIPLPSLTEQECIVKILDKFDALVNDISSGLPAEIEARRKQYEYYRDRLLTFPRASESTEHKH